MAGLAFMAPVFYGGVVLLVFGLAAYGGTKINFQSATMEPGDDSTGRKRVGVIGGMFGALMILVGLVLAPSDNSGPTSATGSSSTSSSSTPPSTMTPVPGDGITVDSPRSAAELEADCNEVTCWVSASGRLGAAVGPELHPYALVAFVGDGGGNRNYWVQYDSTEREGASWSARLYLDPESSGPAAIKAVLLSDPIQPPNDEFQGLTYEDALANGANVVAESDPVEVTITTG
jgi:hypothetical protein